MHIHSVEMPTEYAKPPNIWLSNEPKRLGRILATVMRTKAITQDSKETQSTEVSEERFKHNSSFALLFNPNSI